MSSLSSAHHETTPTPPPSAQASAASGADLLRAAQFGDRAAFGKVVVLFQDRLYNAILRLVGDRDEASDLTQETFVRALSKIEGFRGDAQPYTWLFRIAVNLTISQLRKVQRHRVFSIDAMPGSNGKAAESNDQAAALSQRISRDGSSPAPDEVAENRERDRHVLEALGKLDAEYRAVLVMRDIEGFDYQQMAEVLELPLGTLKSRLFRARIALRDELKPYFDK